MRSLVRRGAGGLFAIMLVTFAGCGDDPTGPVATTSVTIRDNEFDPAAIVVTPGATVTWTWTGSNQHNVLFTLGSINDGPLQSSGTFSTAMPAVAGTYEYACNQHLNMSGTVVVQ